ncbi:VCBS repeat-containing protein [Candidatus Kapabacteria bacterium]|nr:VCBS repeat-containing protein [Candidatus Kapabacteria bacterium]
MKKFGIILLFLFISFSLFSKEKLFQKLTPNQSGIDFINDIKTDGFHNIFGSDYFYNGGGVAIGDLNNDGLQDIVLSGNRIDSKIYINKGNLKFEDVSESFGFSNLNKHVTGVTLADVNSDGFLDIYLSVGLYGTAEISSNMLWINKEGKSFSEQSKQYGLNLSDLTTQVAFFDYDKDGDLDMYCLTRPRTGFDKKINEMFNQFINPYDSIANQKGISREEFEKANRVDDKFMRNDNGKFVQMNDIGLDEDRNFFGLGVVTVDLNNDGWTDIYATSDYSSKDLMYMNQGDGTFQEIILSSLKQTSTNAMGVDINDYDNDGLPDIVVVDMTADDNKRLKANMSGMAPELFSQNLDAGNHYEYMFNTLQRNNGDDTYSQIAFIAGMPTTDWSWAPLFADFDNDTDKDLFITNGIKYDVRWTDITEDFNDVRQTYEQILNRVDATELTQYADFEYNYNNIIEQYLRKFKVLGFNYENTIEFVPSTPVPNYVYENQGGLALKDVSSDWGLNDLGFSNGASYGDLDNDGDLDLVVNNTDDYSFIYKNNSEKRNKNNYINFEFKGPEGNSFGLNTKVYIKNKDTKIQYQEFTLTRGFLSSVEPRLHFGLKDRNTVDTVEIVWLDGKTQTLLNVPANKTHIVEYKNASGLYKKPVYKHLFTKVEGNVSQLDYVDNLYDDYEREILLPHKMSKFGPGLATADLNGDGFLDYYMGGSKTNAGKIIFNFSNGKMVVKTQDAFETDKNYEDLGALFIDVDGDGDKDLYVVSGSNEEEANSEYYQDRLYLNTKGVFERAVDNLPKINISGSLVTANDFDKDGDLDLFVGGRQVPGQYPYPASSMILQNNKGVFTDITESVAPELIDLGMVTSALWTDYDNDGDRDLMIAGEWMPLTFFKNENGKFDKQSSFIFDKKTNGWWWSLQSGDFDNDGDIDYVAGNLGLNYKYEASQDFPFVVYSDDFDHNGQNDIVLSYYEKGICYPLRGRSCSSQQIPEIKKKFPSYNLFSEATVTDVYGKDELNKSLELKAYHFASSYIENNGDGTFKVKALPDLAQISTMFGIAPFDYDGDGNLDILTSGNFYESEIETPRADASVGLFLKGDGKGNFESIPSLKSGFVTRHNNKGLALVNTYGKNLKILALSNDGPTDIYEFDNKHIIRILRAKDDVEKIEHHFNDGKVTQEELYFGSGYLTQNSRMIALTKAHSKVILHKTDGTSETFELAK